MSQRDNPRRRISSQHFTVLGLALSLAAFSPPSALGQAIDRWFPSGGIRVVRLDSDEGAIRCVGANTDEVHLSLHGSRNGGELRPEDARFEQAMRADTLILTVRLRSPSSPFAVYQDALLDLGVPADVAVDAAVEDGSIDFRHVAAGGRIRTRDGAIHVEDCGGPLELFTRDGDAFLEAHNGPLSARIRDGSLRASGFFPRLAVQSQGGRVEVRMSGGSLARPAGAPGVAPDCWIHTGGGRVNLKLPKELPGILIARTGGQLDAGPYETRAEGQPRGPGDTLRVLLGLGATRVEVQSDSGTVTLR